MNTIPGEKLTVAGNISAHGSLSATGAGYNYFNSRVGIGVTAPASNLHVEGPIRVKRTGVDAHGVITMDGNFKFAAHSGYSMTFHTNQADIGNTEIVRFRNDTGNVGIGNTAANEKLTVSGNISAQGYISCCGTSTSKVVCGTSCVRGAYVCSTGDICASSGVVYGGGCVCGACVTDGYSCFDGGGNVCASYYVCAGSCVLASGDICATGGTVCGYYICGSYGYFGTVSKSSGSFNIDHPLESKKDTHKLVHSFIEGPQADNIYSGVVQLTSGSATINIDNCANMTEGTFVALNRCIRTFANNESNWDLVRSRVSGNIVTVESCVSDSTADVSWMVIGERQDPHMYDPKNPMTNNQGQVIVEPVKPALSGEE